MNNFKLLQIFRSFSLIRELQSKLIEIYHPEDLMRCPIHFSLGQEALPSCLAEKIQKKDYLLSHHRSHGYFIAKGGNIKDIVSEFYGKKTGSNSGLAGSQELSSVKNNFFSGTILSGMFGISLGTAYSQKNNNSKNITIAVIGDGGMEEGIVYETLNIASFMNLPILFICENNKFSVHTHYKKRTTLNNFKKLAHTFKIKYIKSNDEKLLNLKTKVDAAYDFVQKIRKPLFFEVDTMRICSHVGPEDDDVEFNYRDSLINLRKKNDPYLRLIKQLSLKFSSKKINEIIKKNRSKVISAINFSRKAKFLNFEDSLSFNFVEKYSNNVKKFTKNKTLFLSNQKETELKSY